MSGVAVIVAKLKAHAPLTAVVPTARIFAGEAPMKTSVPFISVVQINDDQRTTVDQPAAGRLHTTVVRARVMVAGIGSTSAGTGYPGLQALMALVLAACSKTRGGVGTVHVDSILPGSEGPDLPTDAPATITRARDFIVKWTD